MKFSEFKKYLKNSKNTSFELWNGEKIPAHYHITEIGLGLKKYIDCGGEIRFEEKITFQLRTADDFDHRITSEKILIIISLFEKNITSKDAEIEVEYQGDTIGKYTLERTESRFVLFPTKTDCLAKDACGIPEKKEESGCCGGGCC